MEQGFQAGCSLEVTLKFAEYENVKPSFWCGLSEKWDTSEDGLMSREEVIKQIGIALDECRAVCEERVDRDIYDVKDVKLFARILEEKQKKGK